jgi:hypothetical protein
MIPFDLPITNKNFETLNPPQYRNFHSKHRKMYKCQYWPPFIQFARWQHWAKHMKQSEVLWGTCCGPNWELAEHSEELHGNTIKQQRYFKIQQNHPPPSPTPPPAWQCFDFKIIFKWKQRRKRQNHIYLWKKVVCLFCFVLLRSTQLGDASDCVLGLFGKLLTRRGALAWFHGIWTCGAKILEYWTISSLKIKLNRSWKSWRN